MERVSRINGRSRSEKSRGGNSSGELRLKGPQEGQSGRKRVGRMSRRAGYWLKRGPPRGSARANFSQIDRPGGRGSHAKGAYPRTHPPAVGRDRPTHTAFWEKKALGPAAQPEFQEIVAPSALGGPCSGSVGPRIVTPNPISDGRRA